MKRILIILVILFMISYSLSQNGNYFPLKEGNQWTFYRSFSKDTITEKITGTQTINNVVYYAFEEYREFSDILISRDSNKVYISKPSDPEKRFLYYDFSADINFSWKVPHPSYPDESRYTVTLESKSEAVQTPAGLFNNCYSFSYNGGIDNSIGEALAPNVGPVSRGFSFFYYDKWDLIAFSSQTPLNDSPKASFTSKKVLSLCSEPNNSLCKISFYIPGNVHGEIIIFNITGKKVEQRNFTAGYHTMLWSTKNHSKGIYLVVLTYDKIKHFEKVTVQ